MTKIGPTKSVPVPKMLKPSLAFQATFACNNCHKLSIGSALVPSAGYVYGTADQEGWWHDQDITWTPQSVGGQEFPDVPEHIASAADESYRCHSIQAYRASILLARAVIEATCKERSVTKGVLAAKINALEAAGHIRGFTKDAAHELRFLGNDMAHGDFIDPVDEDDAEAVLDVMREILNEVYQGPARVNRMKAKRESKATAVAQG